MAQEVTPDITALIRWRNAEADAWGKAMAKADPEIGRKINAYIATGAYEAEMSTKLVQAQETLLEVTDGNN